MPRTNHSFLQNISLRWHYPNQVKGKSSVLTLSLHMQAPHCRYCYNLIIQSLSAFARFDSKKIKKGRLVGSMNSNKPLCFKSNIPILIFTNKVDYLYRLEVSSSLNPSRNSLSVNAISLVPPMLSLSMLRGIIGSCRDFLRRNHPEVSPFL